MDANDRITRIKKATVGEYKIKDLYINEKQVPIVSSMKKNGSGEITELYINEEKQKFPESGSVNAFETYLPCFILNNPLVGDDCPFVFINADGTFCTTLEEVPSAKFAFDWYVHGGGTATFCYRTNSTDEWLYKGDDFNYYVDDCIFTISEGVISLPDPQQPSTTNSYSIRLPNAEDGWLKDGYPLSTLMASTGS